MNWQTLKKPILAVLVTLGVQLVVSILVSIPVLIVYMLASSAIQAGNLSSFTLAVQSPWLLSVSLILSWIVTIWIVSKKMKMVEPYDRFSTQGLNAKTIALALVAAVAGIFATDLLSELLNMPDWLSTDFRAMSHSAIGVLAIGVFGPICEEIVFRGAIQGWFHRHGVKPQWAIGVAALMFGLIHLNPAQIPFAFIVGIILGVAYWKSQSLILPCLIHIANNCFSCLMMNVAPDASLIDLVGGAFPTLILIIIGYLVCVWLFRLYLKEGETRETVVEA